MDVNPLAGECDRILQVNRFADGAFFGAIEQNDLVLTEMNGVLSILIKYETQNELLDIVRKMIKKQNEIMERTKKERERKAFDGLLD